MSDIDQQITKWKEEHGRVFKLPFSQGDVYYKRLSREDYVDIQEQTSTGMVKDHELEACKRCILNQLDGDRLTADGGIVTVLYDQLMKDSGFLVIESEEL